jgi:diguanylate cyclase (GGDEF)-like protein
LARQQVLAALAALLVVAAAGALRRVLEQGRLEGVRSAGGAQSGAAGAPGVRGQVAKTIVDRRTLNAMLDAEWVREQGSGTPTALLLLVVDAYEHFREQGPIAGDVTMLTLASALLRSLPREADLLARYDESTFAVVLRGTDLPGSLRVAARLRWSIVRLGIANPRTTSGFLTICIGLVVQHGPALGGTEGLLNAAGTALDKARSHGDDRLEYMVLGLESQPSGAPEPTAASAQASTRASAPMTDLVAAQAVAAGAGLPTIRARSAERGQVVHSPQS